MRALIGNLSEGALNTATDVRMSRTNTRNMVTKYTTKKAVSSSILKCCPDELKVELREMLLVELFIL